MQQKEEKNELKRRNKRQRKGLGSSVLCFEMVDVCVWMFVSVCLCRVKDQISTIEVHNNINNNDKG